MAPHFLDLFFVHPVKIKRSSIFSSRFSLVTVNYGRCMESAGGGGGAVAMGGAGVGGAVGKWGCGGRMEDRGNEKF